jgi:hypothetical protein
MSRRDYLKHLGFATAVAIASTTVKKLEPFRVRVTRIGDENGDYSYASGYEIEAPNFNDAEREARKRFCEDFGAPYDKTVAHTFNKQQK